MGLLLLAGYIGYGYLYKDHRDIAAEASTLEISALELIQKFKNGEGTSLLNKTITVSGKLTQVEPQAITLDEAIYGSFDANIENLNLNDSYRIKGRCIGYDDLFEIVKLDQCTILK